MTSTRDDLRCERRGAVGVITLDRPAALNALTHDMVRRMSATLAAWRTDPRIGAVLVKAAPGRAFCAGGDVRAVAEAARDRGADAAMPFFQDEYRLNWRIHTFPKPFVAFMDGITMGGGVGISVHGSFRVVTENTVFAMPETGIGFFPDVGGSWFLPRCPGQVGAWMGLTGARLQGGDLLEAELGTHAVPAAALPGLEDELVRRVAADGGEGVRATVAACLREAEGAIGPATLPALRARIDGCFAGSLPQILERLGHEPTGFGTEQLAQLAQKSPLAVQVTHELLRRGRALDIAGCLALEHRLVRHILEAGDFVEGVRALLIDKDRRPRWRHATLADVTPAEVAAMFAPLAAGELTFDWRDDAGFGG